MAAASGTTQEEHNWNDDTPSGFLKLSAEIRNKVYYLTLVTGSVTVKDLHPEEWQADKEAGHATRSSYKTKDHDGDMCSHAKAYPQSKRCTFKGEQWKNAKVSYTLRRESYLTPPTIAMLALNHQIRAEAIPVFYGGNEIRFNSMSAVLPFVRDRSELSLQSMQYFHLDIGITAYKCQASRQEGWAQIFAEFPRLRPLNLQKLTMRIYDPECRYAWKLKLDTKMQRWVHEMAKSITNLDMLGVTFDFSVLGELTSDEMVKEYSPTQELLWQFLAPKMLKKVGDEPHDAHSLLKRRIRDDLHKDSYEDEVGF